MDPFSSLASRVLYEERVAEAVQRYHWAHSDTRPARTWQLLWLAAMAILRVR
ncbi:hypothetical protein K2Z83_17535 [Oscillochloris sp. ZM17-4]|uniref:hypothetical protein n=1 Tax=Oscillochloris sp. ZM17-4 TaxID=2866714 RepID=UPI001C73B036|nr:hypothetical protein [Oscillochloris sp. ZM17-4]MBX0329475.1 hypothetical protein [Oscillochloris sp. ZM17-4]